MQQLFPSQKIYIANSHIPKAGRGVFAKTNLHKGDLVEQVPVIVIPQTQVDLLRKTELLNYFFAWGDHAEKAAIALGFGSIYNHSYTPNAMYKKIVHEQRIEFVVIEDIKEHEEITINYTGDPKNKSPLWIKSIPSA